MADRERLVVVCQVTEECNLGCAFCGYDRRLPRTRLSADPDDSGLPGRLQVGCRSRAG